LQVIITFICSTQVTRRSEMVQYTLPEFIWLQASARLPERMLLGLKRWVVLGTMLGESESQLSRYSGGRG
jgi:hypothetical protein